MDIRIAVASGAVQRHAAGEDDIGRFHQGAFQRAKIGRRESKGGQFVHLVEDDEVGGDAVAERQRHRRVIPEQ
jgi:hypothetical protein